MYFKSPYEVDDVSAPPPSQCCRRHTRLIFYLLFVLSLIVIAVDWFINMFPIKLTFYILTNACLVFRLFGLNCCTCILHVLLSIFSFVLFFVYYVDISKGGNPLGLHLHVMLIVLLAFVLILSLHMMVFRHGKTPLERLVRVGLHSTIGIVYLVIHFWAIGPYCNAYLNPKPILGFLMFYMLLLLIMFLTPQFLSCSQEVVVIYKQNKCNTEISGDIPMRCILKPKAKPKPKPKKKDKEKEKVCNCAANARDNRKSRSPSQAGAGPSTRNRSPSPSPADCGCSGTGLMHSDSSTSCAPQRAPAARPSRMQHQCQCSSKQRSNDQRSLSLSQAASRVQLTSVGHASSQRRGSMRSASPTRGACNSNERAGRKRVRRAASANRRRTESPARSLRQSKSEANIACPCCKKDRSCKCKANKKK